MRTTLLLPATCLALLAAPAAAQQAAPAPQPGPAETAPAPAPAPEQPTPRQGMGMPHEMGREMGMGMHAHRGMFQAPGLRIRFGGMSLDLRCAVGDTSEACAQTALGIIDHLSQMAPGGGAGQDESGDRGSGGERDDGGADQDSGGGDQ
jgi:hypothetical protein